jgi:hypothetical protein
LNIWTCPEAENLPFSSRSSCPPPEYTKIETYNFIISPVIFMGVKTSHIPLEKKED